MAELEAVMKAEAAPEPSGGRYEDDPGDAIDRAYEAERERRATANG